MTGLLTKVDRPLMRAQGRFDPNLRLDLPFVPSASIYPFRGTATAFSRSSDAYCFDSLGTLRQAVADVPCFDHEVADNYAPLGVWIQAQSANEIRNNTMQGAVASTDTLPDHWSLSGFGPSLSVEDVGTEAGLAFIDVRFSGTANGSARAIWLEDAGVIAAALGETWSFSTYTKLVAGDFTNVNAAGFRISEWDAVGPNEVAWTGAYDNAFAALGGSVERIAGRKTLADASVASLRASYLFQWAPSGAVDFTLRLYLPQLEQAAWPTSPIKTSGTATTRNADVLTSTHAMPTEGTLVLEAKAPDGQSGGDTVVFRADDGTDTNSISLMRAAAGGGNDRKARGHIRGNGGTVHTLDGAIWNDAAAGKLAMAWSQTQNKAQFSHHQATPVEVTWADDFSATVDRLSFGHDRLNADHFGGSLKTFRLFDIALFDADLQAL